MELIRLNKINLHRIGELNRLFFLFCCTHDNAPSGEIAGETEERNKELGAILFNAQEAFINANWHKCCSIVTDTATYLDKEDVDYSMIPLKNESDSVIDNATKITVGCKIRSKTNPNEILSIISDDCHGDEFECSNGSVLSSKQIEKYYELIK